MSSGYGVTELQTPQFLGNKFYCSAIAGVGCTGPGVVEFASNPDNVGGHLSEWTGLMENGRIRGVGVMTLSAGDRIYAARALQGDTPRDTTGVWVSGDGRRFEGIVGAQWVRGVLWSANGGLQCYGYWKNGSPDNDRNRVAGYPDCR